MKGQMDTLIKAEKQKKVRKVMKAMNEFMDEDKSCIDAGYRPRYSGAGLTGICKCGHAWDRHHLGVVMNREYGEATGEAYVPEECEAHGFNETGGLKFENGEWVNHCHAYEDQGE